MRMTDDKIIKALQCCSSNTTDLTCYDCPLYLRKPSCYAKNAKNALELIKRQQEKIERLQKSEDAIDNFARKLCRERELKGKVITDFEDLQEYIRKEKSEAVREFVERLCEGRVFNDPVVIAVKAELEMIEKGAKKNEKIHRSGFAKAKSGKSMVW